MRGSHSQRHYVIKPLISLCFLPNEGMFLAVAFFQWTGTMHIRKISEFALNGDVNLLFVARGIDP